MTIASRAHRRPCALCGPPTARPTARAARYAHDTSSHQPASPSGGAGRRAGHEPHPLADGRNHRGGTLGGPGARPLSSRAGATSATACQWGLDGPSAAVRTPISLGKVANEGPGVRHRSGGRRSVPLHERTIPSAVLTPPIAAGILLVHQQRRGCAAPGTTCGAGGDDAYGRVMPYIRSSGAPPSGAAAATKSVITPPPHLSRLIDFPYKVW